MTDFTPETPVLTPIRDHAAELAKAEAGVAEMAAKRNNRWYPKYHIASNGGHQVLSSYSYASEGPRALKLVAESGSLKVDSLKLHHMKSIGLE